MSFQHQGEATEWFNELDKDNSGSVDMNEFLAGNTLSTWHRKNMYFSFFDLSLFMLHIFLYFFAVYNERTTTKAQDIGRLGQATEAMKHRYDARTSDNTSAAELAEYKRTHAHEQTSAELAKANSE
jgi:hypothetical protein